MPLPDVTFNIVDGALGILPEQTDKLQLTVGVATDGPVNRVLAMSSKNLVLSTFGRGPLVEASLLKLDIGGGPLYLLRTAASSSGETSAVTGPASAPALTVTGEAADYNDVRVRIASTGPVGTSRFAVSLDGGTTYAPEIATAATYPIGDTGLTLGFAAGTYTAGTIFSFTTQPRAYAAAELSAALDAALVDPREWGIVHVVGTARGATDAERARGCVGVAALVGTKMAAAASVYRFARAVVEAPPVLDSALLDAFGSFVDPRVAVAAGFARTLSPLDGTQKWRPVAWPVLAKMMKKPLGKDPAQVLAEAGTGPLPSAVTMLERDERQTPNLDGQRFVTLRTHIGRPGFYVTNFPLMSSPGSDFKYIQHGQVIDNACKVARGVLLEFLSRDLDLAPDGTLDEGQAEAIDQKLEEALRASLVQPGHASGVYARTNRTDDVLRTETLRGSFRVQPKFYPKTIEFDVGFTKTVPSAA